MKKETTKALDRTAATHVIALRKSIYRELTVNKVYNIIDKKVTFKGKLSRKPEFWIEDDFGEIQFLYFDDSSFAFIHNYPIYQMQKWLNGK